MRNPLDPRLIQPNDLPVVKTDYLFQRKREKLHAYRVIRVGFLDTTYNSGTQYPCSTWDYMSVYTTGAINSKNVGRREVSNDSVLSILFDDMEEYIIKAETPYPIPLVKKQWFRLYREMSTGQTESEDLEVGYGDLIILLHNFPYIWNIKKHNPDFCAETDMLEQNATQSYWIGVDRTVGTDDLLIPYLPHGYEYLHICATSTLKNFTIQIDQYMNSRCSQQGGSIICTTTLSQESVCTAYLLCTDRLRLTVKNLETEDDAILFHGFFTGKADNR